MSTLNPYMQMVTNNFLQAQVRKREIEDDFKPELANEYTACVAKCAQDAVNLIKMGASTSNEGDTLGVLVEGQFYDIDKKEIKKYMTAEEYKMFCPEDVYEEPVKEASAQERNNERAESKTADSNAADMLNGFNNFMNMMTSMFMPMMNQQMKYQQPQIGMGPQVSDDIESIKRRIAELEKGAVKNNDKYHSEYTEASRIIREKEREYLDEKRRMEKELRDLNEEKTTLEIQYATAQKLNEDFDEQRAALEKNIEDKKSELQRIKGLTDNLEREKKELNKKNDELQTENESLGKELEELNNKLREAKDRLDVTKLNSNKEKEEAEKRIKDLEGQLENLKHLKSDNSQQVQELRKQLNESDKEKKEAQERIDRLSNELGEVNDKLSEARREAVEVKDKLEDVTSQKEEVETELEKLSNEKAALKEKYEESQRDLDKKSKELQKIFDDLAEKDKNYKSVKELFENREASLNEYKEQVARLQEKNDALEKVAYTDQRTGVFNAVAFNRDFPAAFNSKDTVLVMIGIRNMQELNQQYGRKAADNSIVLLSKTISRTFESSQIYRVMSTRFAVLIKGGTVGNTTMITQGIKKDLEKEEIQICYGISKSDNEAYKTPADFLRGAESELEDFKNNNAVAVARAEEKKKNQYTVPPETKYHTEKTEEQKESGLYVVSDDELSDLLGDDL